MGNEAMIAQDVSHFTSTIYPNYFVYTGNSELRGLLDNGTFKPAQKIQVPKGMGVFDSRFIDEWKRVGPVSRNNSLLVAKNYNDSDITYI